MLLARFIHGEGDVMNSRGYLATIFVAAVVGGVIVVPAAGNANQTDGVWFVEDTGVSEPAAEVAQEVAPDPAPTTGPVTDPAQESTPGTDPLADLPEPDSDPTVETDTDPDPEPTPTPEITPEPGIARVRETRLDADAALAQVVTQESLAQARMDERVVVPAASGFTLELFDDRQINVTATEVALTMSSAMPSSAPTVEVLGQATTPEGGAGSVTLAFVPGAQGYELTGAVQENSSAPVMLTPEGADTYHLEESDLTTELGREMSEPTLVAPEVEDVKAVVPKGAQAAKTIDVLVGFANNFPSVGFVHGYIASQIAFMNQAMANSGVTLRVRVMDIRYVNYTQSGNNLVADVENLRSGAGDLWRLKNGRDALGADLVTLIVPAATNACGVAARPSSRFGAREGGAYSVTATAPYCSNKFTLAHELGHSLGLSHNPEIPAAAPPVFPYSHGSSTPGVARDVMGYECWSGARDTCPVRLQYSNPWVNYLGTGVASGEPAYRNAARALNEMAATIANYRDPVLAWDVPTSHQFFKEITWMLRNGYSTGFADGRYSPNEPVSREAMAAFLYRYAGSPSYRAPARSPFTDVPRGSKFYKQIAWLSSKGITTGYRDKTFRPKDAISRQAMAAFFYRYAGSPRYSAPARPRFSDVGRSAKFYKHISWFRSTGITTGYAGGTYKPHNPVTRAAMAAFIYRYDKKF